MPGCKICGKESGKISKTLSVCLDCIRDRWDEALPFVENAHAVSRKRFEIIMFFSTMFICMRRH